MLISYNLFIHVKWILEGIFLHKLKPFSSVSVCMATVLPLLRHYLIPQKTPRHAKSDLSHLKKSDLWEHPISEVIH